MKSLSGPAKWARTVAWLVAASALYALAFNWFFVPNGIAYGGVTGISMIVNALLGVLPVGVMIILFNIPLFIVGWRIIGGRFLISSLFTMILSSVLIDLIRSFYAFKPMEPLLASIYGGVFLGLSLGVIFANGATTGGSDIVARLLRLKFAYLPMGRLMLILDLVVITAAALVFQKVNSALYGIIALYISSMVMDTVLYGMDYAKVAYIISDKSEALSTAIRDDLDRGATILYGKGTYTGASKNVILCAFKRRQIVDLKNLIKSIDPDAFMIVCEAHEVLGSGFGSYDKI